MAGSGGLRESLEKLHLRYLATRLRRWILHCVQDDNKVFRMTEERWG